VRVKVLRQGAQLPVRATAGATGWDIFAHLEMPPYVDIGLEPVIVPTGLSVEVPAGVDVQVRPRSGLASKGVLAVFGTVDADYRGEILVTLHRIGADPTRVVRVHHGDRIAQLVFSAVWDAEMLEVDRLTDTPRGAGGHGSTGT
jgi:dUTP pyrophosphatase